jgi:hypothetical protein
MKIASGAKPVVLHPMRPAPRGAEVAPTCARVTDSSGPFPPPPTGGRSTLLRGVEVTAYAPSDLAEAEAARVVSAMTTRPDLQKKLKAAKVELVIIPKDTQMTALPEFASMRGQRTFDGRQWDSVRGVGGTRTDDGRWAVGIPEENLADLPSDSYPGNYSVATHELAHVIHEHVTKAEKHAIDLAFEARTAAGGPWTEAYGSSNVHEYFAQSTNAFFDRNEGMGQSGKAWLKKNDPAIFELLTKIYPAPT